MDKSSLTTLPCCETENFRLNVTPITLIEPTLVNPENPAVMLLLLGLTDTVSADVEQFNFRLSLSTQISTLLTRVCFIQRTEIIVFMVMRTHNNSVYDRTATARGTIRLRYLLSTELGHDRRNHVTSGCGRPVALHVSLTVSPSRTVTSELDKWSMIWGGTGHAKQRQRPSAQFIMKIIAVITREKTI